MAIQDLSRLFTVLNATKLNQENPALYQLLFQLIQMDLGNTNEFARLLGVSSSSGGGGGGGSFAPTTATYLTVSNELAVLPNSRRVLAGTGITFDDSVGGVRTINGSAISEDYVVMSDGANPAQPMNDGNGNFIYIPYTP